jgi:hypothetical protein
MDGHGAEFWDFAPPAPMYFGTVFDHPKKARAPFDPFIDRFPLYSSSVKGRGVFRETGSVQ